MICTCRRQIQFLQSSAHTSLTLSGPRDPKPQSARLCFTDCRPHKRIRRWGIMIIVVLIVVDVIVVVVVVIMMLRGGGVMVAIVAVIIMVRVVL